ncbi:Amino acid/amide ABC transporter membrane protein 2, HAAT family [Paraburkholderia ribeironis]|uniref:Amino acid/amide ABC transporter membrane protein 2, HAAT family n=1 Tax=Paraburkholderia ribeironis TaxID=1247936 RepID=A0A1N7RZM2_9BURK|nr:branched-chain amino acid ABC transporter permease [Paraburkholderia ribeironis]SIT40578.1 Amino acid/amide ABC transporter membrane protein 2, HAAT family [Paraburkholderia ribeironis]
MRKKSLSGLAILALVLCVVPFIAPNSYYMDIAIRMSINAVIVLSLNLLMGYAGQISLGHAGFVGIGAYASAVLPTHFGIHPLLAIVLGAVAAGVIAQVVARPILRLKGHYLAMATLGLGIIISYIIRNENSLTGGPDGMPVQPLSLFGVDLVQDTKWYWIVAVVLFLNVWGALNLIDSPFGRALRGLHGSEIASQVVGINVPRYKTRVFVLSAIVASFMGSLLANYAGFVTPDLADFNHAVALITMVVVGGMASVFGSVVGAVLLTMLPQLLASIEGWETVIFGVILIVSMIFLPRGVVPTLAARMRLET